MERVILDHESKTSDDDTLSGTSIARSKARNVRFDPSPPVWLVDPCDRTSEEISQCWWTRRETRAAKQVSQRVATASRSFCTMPECVQSLHRLMTSERIHHNPHRESYLSELMVVAIRLVKCSRHYANLRGLEFQVCNKKKLKTRADISRICQDKGMSDDMLCRLSQHQSRFDRMMAQLLGEADARYQREQMHAEQHGTRTFASERCKGNDDDDLIRLLCVSFVSENTLQIDT